MSIWNGVDRLRFEIAVQELYTLARSQKPPSLSEDTTKTTGTSPVPSEGYVLPFEIEKQVCDDIAFLAASDSSPNGVTGVTLQKHRKANGINFVLAANRGVSDRIVERLEKVFRLLEQCAQGRSREDCVSQCLDVVLLLHEDRIRERLGLNRRSKSKVSPWVGSVSVSDRLRKMEKSLPISGSRDARDALLSEITDLKGAIIDLENSPNNDHAAFKRLIELASRFAPRNNQFKAKLFVAGLPDEYLQRNEIRQLKGLANYHHCCLYLCNVARIYRSKFSSIRMTTLPAYPVERWPVGTGNKHYVHAEIQLLVYHDMNPQDCRPRYIGVSKKACFLCYCFIQRYGVYYIKDTHGEVHPQWTIPDRNDYTRASRHRLRAALIKARLDIDTALAESQSRDIRFGPQGQSPSHSNILSLATASASTLVPATKVDSMLPLDSTSLRRTSVTSFPPLPSPPAISSSGPSLLSVASDSNTTNGCEMTASSLPSMFKAGWLTLYMPLETQSMNASDTKDHHDISGNECKVSWHAAPLTDPGSCKSTHIIDVGQLKAGQSIQLESKRVNEVDVVFAHHGRQELGIRFTRRDGIV